MPEEISSEDWHLVITYAHLAEGIGIEKLSRGVDEALLPASKDRLRRTLALASRSPRTMRDLKAGDLPKLYGCSTCFCRDSSFPHMPGNDRAFAYVVGESGDNDGGSFFN